MKQYKEFKGRCILHPGIYVGVTNFTQTMNELQDEPYIGYGIFTDQDIPAGTILEESIAAAERIPLDSKVLSTYRFPSNSLDNEGNKGYKVLLGMISLCNHNELEFNAYVYNTPEFVRMSTLIANRDISAGEEIFINYKSVSNKEKDNAD